jgi:putative ABC transport system permease protein
MRCCLPLPQRTHDSPPQAPCPGSAHLRGCPFVRAPRWARAFLALLAPPSRTDEIVGDLEEAHRKRLDRHGRGIASLLTTLETLDMALALLRLRRREGGGGLGPATGRRTRNPGSRLPAGSWPPAVSWIDVKLGARVMVKHPALSLVSTLGMAVAVAIGVGASGVIRALISSPLPLDEGHRIVTVQNVGPFGLERARSTHLHSLSLWREESGVFAELAAYRFGTRNLLTPDGAVTPVRVVEMTASGFRIARVPPHLGRYLVDDDEEEGAPAVAVIGYGVWQERFGASPEVVGRSLRIGTVSHTIVGVMPSGFAFPINDRLWVPLRLDPGDFLPGEAPDIEVFGRLAPGVEREEASSRLTVVSQRLALAHAGALRNLRPGVFPYTRALIWGPMAWILYLVQTALTLLVVVIAVNVASLVYARTAAREGELAVRTALGASRGRIVSQLFVEALLLSCAASPLGLGAAAIGIPEMGNHLRRSMGEDMPFWWNFRLSSGLVLYGFGLTVLVAVIVGVIPALGATGRHLQARLRSAGSGASGPPAWGPHGPPSSWGRSPWRRRSFPWP